MPPDLLVSVIVPAFNAAEFLPAALASILNQPNVRQEIIVVDDGSTDETARLPAVRHPLVRLLRQANQGAAAARNTGIKAARGEWLAFLDADDIWPAGRQERLLSLTHAAPELRVVQGRLQRVQCDMSVLEAPRYAGQLGTALFHREVFDRVGAFDAQLKFSEDLDLFLRIQDQGLAIGRVPDVVLQYRQHDDSLTHGQAPTDLFIARVLKRSLDRRRASMTAGAIP